MSETTEQSKIEEKYKEATEAKKFEKEDMDQISQFRDKFIDIQRRFGQGAINKIRLEQSIEILNGEMSSLRKEYTDLQESEKDFVDGITKKYGEGTLNPETGEFLVNTEVKPEK